MSSDEECLTLRKLLKEAIEKAERAESHLSLRRSRLVGAQQAWQKATGNADVFPDLGELLEWLLARAERTEAERDEWKAEAETNALSERYRRDELKAERRAREVAEKERDEAINAKFDRIDQLAAERDEARRDLQALQVKLAAIDLATPEQCPTVRVLGLKQGTLPNQCSRERARMYQDQMELLDAFEESEKRIHELQDTLDLERRQMSKAFGYSQGDAQARLVALKDVMQKVLRLTIEDIQDDGQEHAVGADAIARAIEQDERVRLLREAIER